MCGRYALHANPDVVALQFGLDALPRFRPRYNIAPATDIVVIRNKQASLARWGLRARFINLRAETVADKFGGAYRNGRCLVPASGFYEWKAQGRRKQPYYFVPENEALFGFAAVWERDSCALITTEANAVMRSIHNRMPLIVAKDDYAAWLAGDEAILGKAPQTAIVARPVGMAVNEAATDSAALLEPIELPRTLFD